MSGPYIVISATFTAEAIEPTLEFWMREMGFDYRIRMAPYNQVFQLLLDPAGELAANVDGVNAVLVRFEDWAHSQDGAPPAMERLEADVQHFVASLEKAASSGSPLVVCICPASPGFDAGFQSRMETWIAVAIEAAPGIHLIRPQEIDALYPVAQVHDPLGEKLGHVPYTPRISRRWAPCWRARSTRCACRPSKPSRSIATTRFGAVFAARMVRKA